MKRTKLSLLAVAALTFGAFAFKSFEGGSITGKVIPPDGAREAWAITGTDTLKTAVSQGAFAFTNAKAGTYTVVIDAKEPYKAATITDVKVADGKSTDLGEIKLAQ